MKLTGKFKQNKEKYLEEIKEFNDAADKSSFDSNHIAWVLLQLDILNAIEQDQTLKLKNVVLDEEGNMLEPQLADKVIAKFNTPDKITDTEGKTYQRFKKIDQEHSIIFRQIGAEHFFIVYAEKETKTE